KVMGSSIAIVAVGPNPGSTPIRVPSSTPTKQYSRLSSVNATPIPRARLENSSMRTPSVTGVELVRQPQPVIEHQDCESRQTDGEHDGRLPSEGLMADGADQNQGEYGGDQAERADQRAEQTDADQYDDDRPQFEGGKRFAFDGEGLAENDQPQKLKQDAEQCGKITGPNAQRSAHVVVLRDDHEAHADGDEHQAGPKILGRLYLHASPPSLLRQRATGPYRSGASRLSRSGRPEKAPADVLLTAPSRCETQSAAAA